MSRQIPKFNPEFNAARPDVKGCPPGYKQKTFEIELVTPMFGGGAEAGQLDPVTLIRPSSIRGHLRFWWRATRGVKIRDCTELARAEAAIFGTAEHASLVSIHSDEATAVAKRPCASYVLRENKKGEKTWRLQWDSIFSRCPGLPYCLFPFQGEPPAKDSTSGDAKKAPAPFVEMASFRLLIRAPVHLWDDLNCAVWAWVNFGGMGARTRRGCGSMYCAEFAPPDTRTLQSWFEESVTRYGVVLGQVRDWPTLSGDLWSAPSVPGSIQAWNNAIEPLREFRQGENTGRASGAPRPGRSFWPEAETIRKLTGQRATKHARMQHIPDDGFPRAELGLPIIFHFPQNPYGNPDKTELYPVVNGARRSRMGSPLILKPLIVSKTQAVPTILRLAATALTNVDLVKSINDVAPLNSTTRCSVRDSRFAGYSKSPLGQDSKGTPRSSDGSAIEAFLHFAEEKYHFKKL